MSSDPLDLLHSRAPALIEAADRFGTPCYVTDVAEIDRCAAGLRRAFPDPWIRQYSLKANPLPAVVERLAKDGLGANVVSAGEWAAATTAGLPNRLISLEGIGKTDAELRSAVAAAAAGEPLRWVTVESVSEMRVLEEAARRARLSESGHFLDLLLRLNPAVTPETRSEFQVGSGTSKFGMPEAEVRNLVEDSVSRPSGLRLRGIHIHVGSQLTGTKAWAGGAVKACQLLAEMSHLSDDLDTVDVGGGFPTGESPSPTDFRESLDHHLAEARVALPRCVAIEPGRYLVASAGWLVTRVLHVRERPSLPQVVVDASMSELIRPALYGAMHPLFALRTAGGGLVATAVEGAVCESTDTFGIHDLPPLHRGDLLVLATTGAYASSMFSHYNGRPRPPEALIQPDNSLTLARPRAPFAP